MKLDPSSKNYKRITTLTFVLATILAFYYIYYTNFNPLIKIFAAIVILAYDSWVISTTNNLKQMFGAYLLGGKRGINFIDNLSKVSPNLWIAFADWGFVLSFGLLSYVVFKKQTSKRMLAFGIVSMFVIFYILLSYSALSLSFINLPGISSRVNGSIPSGTQTLTIGFVLGLVHSATQCVTNSGSAPCVFASPFYLAIDLVLLAGGFLLFIFALLALNALEILYGIGLFFIGVLTKVPNPGALGNQVPGVAPIIPGLTIPLFAGLVTLAIILVVHEFSHGVLARIAKVKIKQIGLLVFGLIPIGAFVEPDEKQVKKLDMIKQNRIFIAGVAANIFTAMIAFLLLVWLATYLLPQVFSNAVVISSTVPNSPASGVIPNGVAVHQWNNHTISNISDVQAAGAQDKPFQNVTLVTNKGTYTIMANSSGKIGVYLSEAQTLTNTTLYGQSVYFLYVVLILSLAFNFFVGIVNLLPLPGLDGWQIYSLKAGKKRKLLNAISIVVLLAFVINVLPWIWILF